MNKPDFSNTVEEIESAFEDIPFGNSCFQNRAFVMAGELTPARAYRHLGLRMSDRIRAIKELQYNRAKEDIDVEEKQEQLKSPDITSFEKRRIELDIQQILDNRKYQDKLLKDAIIELEGMYAEFKRFPRYTRAQFEAEEQTHFQIRLSRQIEIANDSAASLDNIRILENHWSELLEAAHTETLLEKPKNE